MLLPTANALPTLLPPPTTASRTPAPERLATWGVVPGVELNLARQLVRPRESLAVCPATLVRALATLPLSPSASVAVSARPRRIPQYAPAPSAKPSAVMSHTLTRHARRRGTSPASCAPARALPRLLATRAAPGVISVRLAWHGARAIWPELGRPVPDRPKPLDSPARAAPVKRAARPAPHVCAKASVKATHTPHLRPHQANSKHLLARRLGGGFGRSICINSGKTPLLPLSSWLIAPPPRG